MATLGEVPLGPGPYYLGNFDTNLHYFQKYRKFQNKIKIQKTNFFEGKLEVFRKFYLLKSKFHN
jgi:hypothetical protein